MLIEATSVQYVFTPVTGPVGVDPTSVPVDKAVIPQAQEHPGSGDWQAASWLAPQAGATPEVALLFDANGYPPGQYKEYVRIHAAPELLVLRSGPIRIGDARP
jgi:hypothetical protein